MKCTPYALVGVPTDRNEILNSTNPPSSFFTTKDTKKDIKAHKGFRMFEVFCLSGVFTAYA